MSEWRLPTPPSQLTGAAKRERYLQLLHRSARASAAGDYRLCMKLSDEREELMHPGPGKRLHACATLGELRLPQALTYQYDLGACNEVHLLLQSGATRRLDDAASAVAPALPCLANAEAEAAPAPAGETSFDDAYPSLCGVACAGGAGCGFSLGRAASDGGATDAEVWTADALVACVAPRSRCFDADALRGALRAAEARCAKALKRGAYYDSYDCGDSGSDDEDGDGDDVLSDDGENDDPAGGGDPSAKEHPPAPPAPPPFDFGAAFPAVAELLCRGGGGGGGGMRQHWLLYQSGVLRVFCGAWRGPRGVLNLGQFKRPAWLAARRYATAHAALRELEAHLLTQTARGRALAAAPARAAKAAARAAAAQARADAARAACAAAAARGESGGGARAGGQGGGQGAAAAGSIRLDDRTEGPTQLTSSVQYSVFSIYPSCVGPYVPAPKPLGPNLFAEPAGRAPHSFTTRS
jgi:hypothetical protein